ncbi:MAG TPA: Zn-dependent hydrolase, partial [Casimicrobiaceae bacterium]|nr:Zn-dependent hydrolase [Casimicrobiaceae bacterium]
MAERAADRVDAERLWRRHMSMARHGARADGGVNRQALSAEERAAWRELIGWGRELGLRAATD